MIGSGPERPVEGWFRFPPLAGDGPQSVELFVPGHDLVFPVGDRVDLILENPKVQVNGPWEFGFEAGQAL